MSIKPHLDKEHRVWFCSVTYNSGTLCNSDTLNHKIVCGNGLTPREAYRNLIHKTKTAPWKGVLKRCGVSVKVPVFY